ncbi:hypothetical protein AN958_00049 [Leucoagaricus sp. SymC.cos]|nr:hypothetical protein AN958_00049 [Leucoagaricus sp. SymC.cos]
MYCSRRGRRFVLFVQKDRKMSRWSCSLDVLIGRHNRSDKRDESKARRHAGQNSKDKFGMWWCIWGKIIGQVCTRSPHKNKNSG